MKLLSHMKFLCDESRMLTGIAAAYGTAEQSESVFYGRAQEIERTQDGAFVPAVRPLQEDALFDLASLTKMFTSVLAMMLVERGALALDERIRDIDSRFIHLGDTTVFDVLSFNACLQTPGRIDLAPTREEAENRLFHVERAPTPRIRLYSDINAMVMKYVIEQKTGLAFHQAVETYILTPLGMTDTFYSVPESQQHRCVCYNYKHHILSDKQILRTDTPAGVPHDPKAALLYRHGQALCGHAGLFSSIPDMVRFAQGLLSEKLLCRDTLCRIGTNYTGLDYGDGTHRQYLGFLCFTKHPNQHLSEVPQWMGPHAFGLSGFTGNHLAIDPLSGHFSLFLGNRCHGKVSNIQPVSEETLIACGLAPDGTGEVRWNDGRSVPSSARYVYFKDECLHNPIHNRMQELGWL